MRFPIVLLAGEQEEAIPPSRCGCAPIRVATHARRPARGATLAAVAALLCSLFVGCDQLMTVGTLDEDVDLASPAAGRDAALDSQLDLDGNLARDASCVVPKIDVCNPITNTGCSAALRMQCAVDLVSETAAGYCTFYAPLDGGLADPDLPTAQDSGFKCLNALVTESCPPTTVCYGNQCRKLCLNDCDCPPADCCSERIAANGFGICGTCTD